MNTITESGLTIKQEAFCIEYIRNNGNGTQAALVAGYAPSCPSESASDLLNNPSVISRIKSLLEAVGQTTDAKIATILERKQIYTSIARAPTINKDTVSVDAALHAVDSLNRMEGIGRENDKSPVQIAIVVKYEEGHEDIRGSKGGSEGANEEVARTEGEQRTGNGGGEQNREHE